MEGPAGEVQGPPLEAQGPHWQAPLDVTVEAITLPVAMAVVYPEVSKFGDPS